MQRATLTKDAKVYILNMLKSGKISDEDLQTIANMVGIRIGVQVFVNNDETKTQLEKIINP